MCTTKALCMIHISRASNLKIIKLSNCHCSPILMAVSCLSPVRIQILMSAFIRVSMVSGTLSWSLSSIAVAPSSCRFCLRESQEKKSVSGDHNIRRSLKCHVSDKNLSRGCVTQSVVSNPHPPPHSSASFVYHLEKPPWATAVLDQSLCVCVHPPPPGKAKDLTRPRGRERGKRKEERPMKLFKLWPQLCCLLVCSSVLSNQWQPHSMENCAWGVGVVKYSFACFIYLSIYFQYELFYCYYTFLRILSRL